jgi:hypothetical protein
MYCPKCGNSNTDDQSFCRACGLKLPDVAGLLTPPGNTSMPEQAAKATMWGGALAYSVVVIAIGLVLMLAGSRVLHDGAFTDIGTVIALLGVGLIGFKGIVMVGSEASVALKNHANQRSVGARAPTQIGSPPPRRALPTGPVPSVTEQTTRELDSGEPISGKRPSAGRILT